MIKLLIACCVGVFLVNCVKAGSPPDSSTVIYSSKFNYRFVTTLRQAASRVKQVSSNDYQALDFGNKVPIVESYNDNVTIDDVDCKVDNRTPREFKPQYSYYSVGDVFYSDSRVCYFPLQFTKKGSKANVTFSETITDPRYFTSVYFTDDFKVSVKEITFRIRAG